MIEVEQDPELYEVSLPSQGAQDTRSPTTTERVRRQVRKFKQTFMTRDGLIGDGRVDYAYLFRPNWPFFGSGSKPPIFFGLESKMPIMLAALLGLQHALVAMGGLMTPAILVSGMAHLNSEQTTYLVSASFLGAGIVTLIQILRLRIPFTKYYIGSGLVCILGVSFTTIPVFATSMDVMYKNGYCPIDDSGNPLPCPNAYGAFMGTSCVCALLMILFSFVPQKILLKLFPPIVNGPVVLSIGASLVSSGMTDWAGGSDCFTSGENCNIADAAHSHPWGSGQYIGLGFVVFVTICICDRWGAPLMKSCSVVTGILVGCIVAAATGYFEHASIDAAPSGQFLWLHTFRMSIYGPIVLPVLAVNLVSVMEIIGDVTATSDVSRLPVHGSMFESRVQGGILAGGVGSIIGGLATLLPFSAFAENNGVIAMTQVASKYTGFFACFWFLIMGVIGKFSAAIVAIPSPVLGGMTTFLFTSVAVSGIRIISQIKFTRRDRIVLAVSLMWALSSMLVPTWFDRVITYKGDNTGKKGFISAIQIVVKSPTAIVGIVGLLANQFFPEMDDYDTASPTAIPIEEVQLSTPPSSTMDTEFVRGSKDVGAAQSPVKTET